MKSAVRLILLTYVLRLAIPTVADNPTFLDPTRQTVTAERTLKRRR
jgi:hypothetical protein